MKSFRASPSLLPVTLLATVLFFTASSAFAIVLSLGDVKDSRNTGQFFKSLEIELKLAGDDIDLIRGIRTRIDSAVDDTGKNLLDEKQMNDGFEPFNQGSWQQNKITLKFKNPLRSASVVKELKGELYLFMPDRDPDSSVVVENIGSLGGKPVNSPVLKRAGIEFTLLTKDEYEKLQAAKRKEAEQQAASKGMSNAMLKAFRGLLSGFTQVNDNDLVFKVIDPNKKVVNYELRNASEEKIKSMSYMTMNEIRVMNFTRKVPDDASLVIFIATPKATKTAQISFSNITLP